MNDNEIRTLEARPEDRQLPAIDAHATRLPALPQEMSIDQVEARVHKVRELQKRIMQDDIHFGVIPGTPKPTLLKPGAELMCLTFMLDPQYEHDIKQDGVNREIISRCVLYHIPTGNRVASGEGSCSTYESKYQYRRSQAECPTCGKELRFSTKDNGWYCWAKMGGCAAKFAKSDPRIKSGGRIVNPDIPDQYNTVLKMANKRSLIAAILNATAASEIFTQDMEDTVDDEPSPEPRVVVKPDQIVKPQRESVREAPASDGVSAHTEGSPTAAEPNSPSGGAEDADVSISPSASSKPSPVAAVLGSRAKAPQLPPGTQRVVWIRMFRAGLVTGGPLLMDVINALIEGKPGTKKALVEAITALDASKAIRWLVEQGHPESTEAKTSAGNLARMIRDLRSPINGIIQKLDAMKEQTE